MPDVDLLILGGGLAGLSLAERLASSSSPPRTHVVEARADYTDDRTWCAWRLAPGRYDDLAAASWSRFCVRSGAGRALVECAETPYQMIPAMAFYDRARDAVAASPRVSLELGVAVVDEPARAGDGWVVGLADGQRISARHVVDTRPPPRRPQSILWQSFLGDYVTAERDVFDPTTAVLMDFDQESADGVQFVYVLPTSRRDALVETTVFGAAPLSPDALRERHARRLQEQVGSSGFRVQRTEHGVLPMGHARPPATPGLVQASLFHGGARASTGYAFARLQAWADACAARLKRGLPPAGPAPDPWLRRAMDEVFLRVLRAEPARGGELMTRMFERADPTRVIRFLSDKGGLRDALSVVTSLPPSPFLRAAWQALRRTPCRGGA
ncbi:MAG: lycopene cyclase family protein [Planctomycetota bacterium]|nr:lycopene cyclase family protein [Planctomycetota bacterium]